MPEQRSTPREGTPEAGSHERRAFDLHAGAHTLSRMQPRFKSVVIALNRLWIDYPLASITSVALTTAVTMSPFFNDISSALRRVITDSMTCSPTRTVTCTNTSPQVISSMVPFRWFLALKAMRPPCLGSARGRPGYPGVGESRIVQQRFVGQRLKKRDQIGALVGAQGKAANRGTLVRIVAADAAVRSVLNRPAANRIVAHDILQRRRAAIVHVRRGHGDVPECGRFEFADILLLARNFVDPGVRRRIRERARNVVQASVVELDLSLAPAFEIDRSGKREPAVTAETRQRLAEIQRLSAARGR